MATRKKKRKTPARRSVESAALESKGSEAITVAWTVSVTSLLCCDVTLLALHYLAGGAEASPGLSLFRNLLLMAGALAGVVSLVLLGVVYRVRTVPPPPALAFFGALVAIAPVLTLLLRQLQ